MKNLLSTACIILQIWMLTACAASADSTTSPTIVDVNGAAYEILSDVALVRDSNWQRVPDARISVPTQDNEQTKVAPASVRSNPVIARFGNMKLVRKASVSAQQQQSSTRLNQDGVLFIRNRNTGQVSIVNGEIFAVTENMDDAKKIAMDYDVQFETYIKRSSNALFSAIVNHQLFDTINAMQKDDRMSQVRLRLINDLVVPH